MIDQSCESCVYWFNAMPSDVGRKICNALHYTNDLPFWAARAYQTTSAEDGKQCRAYVKKQEEEVVVQMKRGKKK